MNRSVQRSDIVEMVADGDLRLKDVTTDGLRFAYTRKGRKKWNQSDRRTIDVVVTTVLAIAWLVTLLLVLGVLRT